MHERLGLRLDSRSGELHIRERLLQRVAQTLQCGFDRVLHSIDHDLLLMLLLLLQLRELLLLKLALLRELVLLCESGRLFLKRIISALLLSVVLSRWSSWRDW